MTPLRFEQLHRDEWAQLETLLSLMHKRRSSSTLAAERVAPDQVAALYRRTCEHLALARARAYPAHILDRLEALTADAHQTIYRDRVFGLGALRRLVTLDFPRAVRREARYIWVAALTFGVPLIVMGLLVHARPELILSIVGPDTAAGFEEMYSPSSDAIGRERTADTDWMMFGFYIRNNISVAFQCFAGGLFAGVGSLFFLGYNGAFGGAIAGYLTERGLSSTFYSFVATHSSFELTAIVLSGAAGLKIGHALLAPGRRTRRTALVEAASAAATILYGVTVLLVVAAAFEAFWSSATWISPAVKYTAAAICWTAVLAYLIRQGRDAG